jgi:hypothetical protein
VPGVQNVRYTEVVSGLEEGEKVIEENLDSGSSGFFGG